MIPTRPDESDLPAIELGSSRASVVGPTGRPVAVDILEAGGGRPVIFLSGLIGQNLHWVPVIRRAARSARCMAVQVPLLELHGDDCGVPGVRDMIAGFIRSTLRCPATLVGSSFGGHVALRVAIEQPELVDGLVLTGSSGLAEKPILGAEMPQKSRDYIEEKVAELFHDRARMSQSDVDRAHSELNDRSKARAMIRLSRSCRRDHVGDELHRIKAPTLVLWGRQDIVTPPEAASEFAERIPDARLVWLERCGHAPMIERPDEFSDALVSFVGELNAASPRRA